jgi:hypothetical protein
MKKRRAVPLVTLATLALLAIASPRRAAAEPSIPIPALTVRNGDWLSLGITTLHDLSDETNFVTRIEVGLGGASLGLGVLRTDGFGKHSNAANVSAEAKLLCTYGLTSWPVSAYVGPEVAAGANFLRLTAGLMFEVGNAANIRPQVGLGIGF